LGRGQVCGPTISIGHGGVDLFVEAVDDSGAGGKDRVLADRKIEYIPG
jgi:hypothetical protein